MEEFGAAQHVGPIIKHGGNYPGIDVCAMHFLSAVPIMCLNCKKHFVAVFYGLGHEGLWDPVMWMKVVETNNPRLAGVEVGVAVVEWIEMDPEGCECGVWNG